MEEGEAALNVRRGCSAGMIRGPVCRAPGRGRGILSTQPTNVILQVQPRGGGTNLSKWTKMDSLPFAVLVQMIVEGRRRISNALM